MADESEVKWGQKQRLEFIEWRAFWEGRINRKDLEQQFNISTVQASGDFTRYQVVTEENNIAYDAVEKTYVTEPDFRPKFLRLSPERYLAQLEAITSDAIEKNDTWFSELPPVDVVRKIRRGPEAFALRALVDAIRKRQSIEINYQSLTSTGSRVICPHAFVHDGFRWHVRALSKERGEFRDYVLGRIKSLSPPQPANADPEDDIEWNKIGTLELMAHPQLSESQRAAIEYDFRIENGVLRIPMRLALAYYFIRRNNLDLRDGLIPADRVQLYLKNYDEIMAECGVAKSESRERVAARNRQPSPR